MLDFIQQNESLLLTLGILSVLGFFATLAIIPWIIIRLPHDYFAKPTRYSSALRNMPIVVHAVLLVFKNLAGVLIVALGIVMLIIPGQGLLTILIGLILIDFPGKYHLQRSLIRRKPVLKSVNWLRERGNKRPLEFGD